MLKTENTRQIAIRSKRNPKGNPLLVMTKPIYLKDKKEFVKYKKDFYIVFEDNKCGISEFFILVPEAREKSYSGVHYVSTTMKANGKTSVKKGE